MKLRILGNSIRVRLQQQELATLVKHGFVQDAIQFGLDPNNGLTYSLRTSETLSEVDAEFEEGQILLSIPKEIVNDMAQTDRVGISHKKPLDDQHSLSILIEKDFKCLTPRTEDADAFPHPHPEQNSC